ncbi:MAG: insulinase family protein [Desulfobacter sp.]|nr:MAG: insulinase family protein [Desulfobacter sp.]
MSVFKKATFGILALLILGTGLFASCIARQPAAAGDCRGTAVPVDPQLVQGTLNNGFRYLIMKNATPKDRVSVHLNVFTGSLDETEKERGIAHFLEHMVFNGSEHFKPGELITYFQSIGMDFGGDANARTSFFTTIYDLSLPKGDREYLENAFLVLRDYAGGALLLESEIDRERGVILAEKRERDSVSYRTFKKELAFELPGAVLARRMPIGTEEVIRAVDRKAMKAFYDRWYRPDNMALVVVGDMDVKLAQSLITERFASMTSRAAAPEAATGRPDVAWTAHKGTKVFYHREPEAGATRVTIERLVPRAFTPETIADLKENTVGYLGDQVFQNRLSRMVREQTADFTSASVYSGAYLRYLDVAAVQASCDAGNWESVLAQLDLALRQALVFGFSQQELDRAKADAVTALNAQAAKAGTRKSPDIARGLISNLNRRGLFLSPEQERDLLVPYIKALSVADVNTAFRDLWQEDQRLVLVTGNLDAGKDPEKKIKAVFDTSRNIAPQPYIQAGIKTFPYLSLPDEKAGVVRVQEDVKGLGIWQADLGNNIRINLKPTDFKKGDFAFKAVFGRGRADLPSGMYGLSTLAEAAVEQSGFGRMDLDELDTALAGRDVSIGFKINESSFSIEGRAAPGEAELVLQLLYTYFKDPGFRPKSLDLAKVHYRQQFEALSRTTEGMMQIQGNRFLAGGDPRFGLADPAKGLNIPMARIESWIRPAFESAPLEVSFVGDFNPGKLKRLAADYLGALGSRQMPLKGERYATGQDRIIFPRGKSKTIFVDSRLSKAVIRASFLTDDFWDIMQTRRLSLLSRVLSERLRNTIREKLGASYSPYVYNNPSLIFENYGVMNAVVNLSPDQIDLVGEQMMELIADLVSKGVTGEELELAKGPLMNHLKVLRQTNSYWLNSVMADSYRYPERLDWAVSLVAGYGGITAEDLNRLAKRYLVPDTGALLKVVPKKD